MLMRDGCDRVWAAFHEAGHFVIGHTYGESEYAELLDDEENCGQTKYKHNLIDIEQKACVLILLAGPLAELKYRQKTEKCVSIEETGSNDIYQAKKRLGWNPFVESDEIYIEQLVPYENSAKMLVSDAWKTIETVAKQLIEKGRVTNAELDKLG